MAKITYEQFKAIIEANAMNNDWLFGEGWELIHQYPEYADRISIEHIQKSFDKEVQE